MTIKALVIAGNDTPTVVLSPLVASLQVLDIEVTLVDAGAEQKSSTVERVWRAITGEGAERRIEKAWQDARPDVVVCLDAQTGLIADSYRARNGSGVATVGVVALPGVSGDWGASHLDRYLTMDDEAAVALADLGVDGSIVLPVGWFAEYAFAAVAKKSRTALRREFKLADKNTITVEVAGFGYEKTADLAMQLSMASLSNPLYLFDAGDDADAAAALRRHVPQLGIAAKLFGASGDTPSYWRCSDVVIGRASYETAYRAMMVGARFVPLAPRTEAEKSLSAALTAKGLAHPADSSLLIGSALEEAFEAGPLKPSRDGGRNAAAAIFVTAEQAGDIVGKLQEDEFKEMTARIAKVMNAVDEYAGTSSAPGELEDLSGPTVRKSTSGNLPELAEVEALRDWARKAMNRKSKQVNACRDAALRWENRASRLQSEGDDSAASRAQKSAEAERARMHQALADMAELEKTLKSLERAAAEVAQAPPSMRAGGSSARSSTRSNVGSSSGSSSQLDDLLERMKREAAAAEGGSSSTGSSQKRHKRKKPKSKTVEDELEALKRKMARDNKK